MGRLRRLGVLTAVVAAGALGLAAPAQADGGDLNGYWQPMGTFSTYEECDAVGAPYVPSQADGWSCTHWVKTGGTSPDWILYLVFAS